MVLVPIFLLTVLNISLLCALRGRNDALINDDHSKNVRYRKYQNELFIQVPFVLTQCVYETPDVLRKNTTASMRNQRTEQRVTFTLAIIVTMYTITNAPSAILQMVQIAHPNRLDFLTLTLLCNTLVICGKASNFILFCLSSKYFRARLMEMVQRSVHKRFEKLSINLSDGLSSSRSYIGVLSSANRKKKTSLPARL
ncbi:hypothetical protein AB6A40_004463 [Gnathostoma spinigerum]|uniref:G-protein coupled receptors family 1 profile domain-containing protein n=1 Tax=Gnathostoma spinigerum TaxID=75299 RepID=A0ABD6EHX8_9BILA